MCIKIISRLLKILFTSFVWFIQSCSPLGNPVDTKISNNHYFNKSKSDVIYSLSGNWFGVGKTEMNADVNSFRLLSEYFSKDKDHVYFKAKTVDYPGVDIASFRSNATNLMSVVGVDKNNVYYVENPYDKISLKIVNDADPKSYEKLDMNWGKDHKNYFHQHIKVNVDYGSFKILNRQFCKDKDRVYSYQYSNFVPIDADANTFKILKNSDYALDNAKVYYFYFADNELGYALQEIPYPLNSTIDLYNQNYLRIYNKVYYKGKSVLGADVKSFKTLSVDYAKDTAQVYFEGEIIPEADAETFHFPEDQYAPTDKNGSYTAGKPDFKKVK